MSSNFLSVFIENKERDIIFDKPFRSSVSKFQAAEIIRVFRENLRIIQNDSRLQERAIVVLALPELNVFSTEEFSKSAVDFLKELQLYDFISSRQERPIHYAAALGNLAFLKHLISVSGTTINSVTSYGATPLHLACGAKKADCVSLLLENGADRSIVTPDGSSPLNLWRFKSGHSLYPFKELDPYSAEYEKRKVLAQVVENEGSASILGNKVQLFGLVGWKTFGEIAISLEMFFGKLDCSVFSKSEQLQLINAFSKSGKIDYFTGRNLFNELNSDELIVIPIENIFPQHCVNVVYYKGNLVFYDTNEGIPHLYPIEIEEEKVNTLAGEIFEKNWSNYKDHSKYILLDESFQKLRRGFSLEDQKEVQNSLALYHFVPLLKSQRQEVDNCTQASALAGLQIGAFLLRYPNHTGQEDKILSELEQFKTYHAIRILADYLQFQQDDRADHLKDAVLIEKSFEFIERQLKTVPHESFILDFFSLVKKLRSKV